MGIMDQKLELKRVFSLRMRVWGTGCNDDVGRPSGHLNSWLKVPWYALRLVDGFDGLGVFAYAVPGWIGKCFAVMIACPTLGSYGFIISDCWGSPNR